MQSSFMHAMLGMVCIPKIATAVLKCTNESQNSILIQSFSEISSKRVEGGGRYEELGQLGQDEPAS